MTEAKSLIRFRSNAPRLTVEYVPIHSLILNARSPRKHPEKQIMMLARNVDTFGFLVPCLIDEKRRLLSGTARVLAAQRLGMPLIPVIPVSHLSEAEKRGSSLPTTSSPSSRSGILMSCVRSFNSSAILISTSTSR